MKRVRIRVFGIDCASCASHLQQMLLGVDGVESVSVNVPGKNAEILADEKRVSLEAVKAAVVLRMETGRRRKKRWRSCTG